MGSSWLGETVTVEAGVYVDALELSMSPASDASGAVARAAAGGADATCSSLGFLGRSELAPGSCGLAVSDASPPALPASAAAEDVALAPFVGTTAVGEVACPGAVPLASARAYCAALGARLCSLAEVSAGLADHWGAGCDNATAAPRVWTATACEHGAYAALAGGSGDAPRGGATCEVESIAAAEARCCASDTPLPDMRAHCLASPQCGPGFLNVVGNQWPACAGVHWRLDEASLA